MRYEEAHDYLLALPRFEQQGAAAYHPGLETITALLREMGEPQRAYPAVHVAGTNGKGSTASCIAAIATSAGRKVGLHTSPHLHDFAERLRVDGAPAPHEWIAGAVARWKPVLDRLRPTYFEAAVALSLLYFAERAVDLAVVEVGLGGRLDATNVLLPRLCVITGIGLDHTELLGGTLVEIAREKAGIIKPGVPVLTGATQPEVLETLRAAALLRSAPFHDAGVEVEVERLDDCGTHLALDVRTPLRRYEGLHVALPGRHQAANAVLAVRAAELLLEEMRERDAPVRAGLRDVRRLAGLRGRLERLRREPEVVLDVAHNPDGLRASLSHARGLIRSPGGHLYVIFGAMRDKDVPEMVRLLGEAGATVLPVSTGGERALPVSVLRDLLAERRVRTVEVADVAHGLRWFERHAGRTDVLLVTGSHTVAARLPDAGEA